MNIMIWNMNNACNHQFFFCSFCSWKRVSYFSIWGYIIYRQNVTFQIIIFILLKIDVGFLNILGKEYGTLFIVRIRNVVEPDKAFSFFFKCSQLPFCTVKTWRSLVLTVTSSSFFIQLRGDWTIEPKKFAKCRTAPLLLWYFLQVLSSRSAF